MNNNELDQLREMCDLYSTRCITQLERIESLRDSILVEDFAFLNKYYLLLEELNELNIKELNRESINKQAKRNLALYLSEQLDIVQTLLDKYGIDNYN